ncbi:hypothetical protein PT115_09275, partial [Erysipelothrix rhusiopathiae]|nr:hypothetical protein [Erysipelothrix rhusiopathiae]
MRITFSDKSLRTSNILSYISGAFLVKNAGICIIESYMKDSMMHIPAFFTKKATDMYDKMFEVRKDLSENVISML